MCITPRSRPPSVPTACATSPSPPTASTPTSAHAPCSASRQTAQPLAAEPERLDEGHLFPMPGVDPGYSEALGRFGNDACRRSLVDDVTSEACRLRNATHQGCHY